MRKICLRLPALAAALFAPACLETASAADLPARMPAPAPVVPAILAPVFSWTGAYLGVNGGLAGDRYSYGLDGYAGYLNDNVPLTGGAHVNSSGFVGGGQIGYNFQFSGPLVLGVEADIQGSGLRGDLGLAIDAGSESLLQARLGSKTTWFGTVRGRLGWAAFDRLLVYVTGGYAYGRTSASYDLGDLDTGSKSGTHGGWTAGGGVEYAILPNWTMKVEYLFVDLGTRSLFDGYVVGDAQGAGLYAKLDEKTRFNLMRAGVNYKF